MRVVFVDVGGTLWADTWPSMPGDGEERAARLHRAVPILEESQALQLVTALAALQHPAGGRQRTKQLVGEICRTVTPGVAVPVGAAIEAVCLPARDRVEPFPGVTELLAGLAGRGARVVVVSNVMWRSGDVQRRDFEDFGLSDYTAAYVTSLDVGWRKPHPFFFDAALAAAGCPAHECVMVGDSEINDIVPARNRGMAAVRVAIEQSPPSNSAAAHVCGSLHQVADLLFDHVESQSAARFRSAAAGEAAGPRPVDTDPPEARY